MTLSKVSGVPRERALWFRRMVQEVAGPLRSTADRRPPRGGRQLRLPGEGPGKGSEWGLSLPPVHARRTGCASVPSPAAAGRSGTTRISLDGVDDGHKSAWARAGRACATAWAAGPVRRPLARPQRRLGRS